MSSWGGRGPLLVVTVFASFSPSSASAYCRMTTESGPQVGNAACETEGLPLFWGNPCLSYAIDSRGSQWMTMEEIDEAVDLAFEAWENVDCGGAPPNLVFTRFEASTCRRPEFNEAGNVHTIAFLDPWVDECGLVNIDDAPFALAVTIVWRDGDSGEMLDADIMINDQLATQFNAGGPYANCPAIGCPPGTGNVPGAKDLQSIVTHEIGHFIGIGHSEVEEATMYSVTDQTSVSKRTLAQDDILAVCDIYPPGSLEQSCDATPIGGLQLNCETDEFGEPLDCDEPGSPPGSGGGGCSASKGPTNEPLGAALGLLLGLSVMRRRALAR